MDLIQEYKNNLEQIKTLSSEQEVLRKKKEKESNQISYDYRDKIYALEKERDNKVNTIKDAYTNQENAKETEIVKLREVHTKVERIINFLKIRSEVVICEDSNIYNRHGSIEPLGLLFSEDYLKIRVFIVENRKPVNKYSLCVYGNVLFPEAIIKPPYGFSLPSDYHKRQDIALVIKDFPTTKQAHDYYEKNKDVLLCSDLREYVLQYQAVKAEYLEVIKTYTLKDFKHLYVLECKYCGCVLTEIGMQGFSTREGKCPSCDISLKEASLIARTTNENLPLLLDRKWETKEAEDFYNHRMTNLKKLVA